MLPPATLLTLVYDACSVVVELVVDEYKRFNWLIVSPGPNIAIALGILFEAMFQFFIFLHSTVHPGTLF